MSYCKNCGQTIDGNYCETCGTEKGRVKEPSQVPKKKRSKSIAVAIVIILGLLVLVPLVITIAYCAVDSGEENDTNVPTQKGEYRTIREGIDIDISTDKREYEYDEPMIITIGVDNNLDETFPYGDFEFYLCMYSKNEDEEDGCGSPSWSDVANEELRTMFLRSGESVEKEITWEFSETSLWGCPDDFYIILQIIKVMKRDEEGGLLSYSLVDECRATVRVNEE